MRRSDFILAMVDKINGWKVERGKLKVVVVVVPDLTQVGKLWGFGGVAGHNLVSYGKLPCPAVTASSHCQSGRV